MSQRGGKRRPGGCTFHLYVKLTPKKPQSGCTLLLAKKSAPISTVKWMHTSSHYESCIQNPTKKDVPLRNTGVVHPFFILLWCSLLRAVKCTSKSKLFGCKLHLYAKPTPAISAKWVYASLLHEAYTGIGCLLGVRFTST